MQLTIDETKEPLEFMEVKLSFTRSEVSNVFFSKNNKSLVETIIHHRYKKLADLMRENYSEFLDMPLGSFLENLKSNGDKNYLLFLNKYGDARYTVFGIDDTNVLDKCGIYCYTLNGNLMYVGRCRDSMKKRINQGYGKIHPKNCFIDGQATNCHLNSLISSVSDEIKLWFCELNLSKIVHYEQMFIGRYKPPWNIQGT